MTDAIPPSGRRRTIGVVNCLAGVLFVGQSLVCATAAVGMMHAPDVDAVTAILWTLFAGGIGGALLWIGVGDLRGLRRPTWVMRLALYVCVVAILTPMVFVAREANRKRQAIKNLKMLDDALRKYEATIQISPRAPTPATDKADPNK